jgi:hypothetical protein
MAQEFKVSVQLGDILALGPLVRAQVFANLSGAVEAVVNAGEERWKTAVLSAPLWEGERQAYAASISARMLTPYSGEITSDYKFVEDIESGRPPYDMKRALDTSTKVRRTRDGRRYLIIPMRQNSTGNTAHAPAMPASVYGLAKGLGASSIESQGQRRSGEITRLSPGGGMTPMSASTQRRNPFLSNPATKRAYMVTKNNYAWGDKLTKAALKSAGASAEEQKRYAGMYRFKESTGGSTYLQFRIMMEGSSGWIIPAKPGLWLAKNVADSLQRTAGIDFPAAVQRDVDAA